MGTRKELKKNLSENSSIIYVSLRILFLDLRYGNLRCIISDKEWLLPSQLSKLVGLKTEKQIPNITRPRTHLTGDVLSQFLLKAMISMFLSGEILKQGSGQTRITSSCHILKCASLLMDSHWVMYFPVNV